MVGSLRCGVALVESGLLVREGTQWLPEEKGFGLWVLVTAVEAVCMQGQERLSSYLLGSNTFVAALHAKVCVAYHQALAASCIVVCW